MLSICFKGFLRVKLVVIENEMDKCCYFHVMHLFSNKKKKKNGNFCESVVSISNRSFSRQRVALEV